MLKKIEMILQKTEGGNINAVSIVKSPAVEKNFVLFSKDNLKMAIDEEKQTVTAPLLIPYQLIYRNSDFYLGECELFFSEETIRDASILLMKDGKINNVTLDHDNKADGASCIELWIVSNSENDKANELGFDVADGTLMATYLIEDVALWSQIKEGKFNGFSIEANFDAIELNIDEAKKELIGLLSEMDNTEKLEIQNTLY